MTRSEIGQCLFCETQCFKVIARFVRPHPMDGVARDLGPPEQENAKRLTLVLSSGATVKVTVCRDCKWDGVLGWQNMRQDWSRELFDADMRWPEDTRSAEAVKTSVDYHQKLFQQIPLGVLCEQRWGPLWKEQMEKRHGY